MKLKKLLKGLPVKVYKGNQEVLVTGITDHSKWVYPGTLFVAKKGGTTDGANYIQEAIANGASAILSDMGDPFLSGVTQLVTQEISEIEGKLASRYYQHPSSALFVVGITGTSGKTTTSYFVKHLFDGAHFPMGLMGTIETRIQHQCYPATLTTAPVWQNHKFLKEMLLSGQKGAVMEVSSIGLDQKRVAEIDFDCAIFTNFSHEHLDYHKTMENYFSAKLSLFTSLAPNKTAVLPFEDPYTLKIQKACRAHTLTYGFSPQADLYAHNLNLNLLGTTFTLTYKKESFSCALPLLGKHNVANALAAIGAAICAGIAMEKVVPLLATMPPVSGRLERVVAKGSHPTVFVDYAHKQEALREVLHVLRQVTLGKLIVVFGCGGDRDKEKRPMMGKVASLGADHCIVTTDNPRTEDPKAIAQDILQGMECKKSEVILDRKEAICRAIELASPQDTILIAGKGHEKKQIFSSKVLSFDDTKVAMEALT